MVKGIMIRHWRFSVMLLASCQRTRSDRSLAGLDFGQPVPRSYLTDRVLRSCCRRPPATSTRRSYLTDRVLHSCCRRPSTTSARRSYLTDRVLSTAAVDVRLLPVPGAAI